MDNSKPNEILCIENSSISGIDIINFTNNPPIMGELVPDQTAVIEIMPLVIRYLDNEQAHWGSIDCENDSVSSTEPAQIHNDIIENDEYEDDQLSQNITANIFIYFISNSCILFDFAISYNNIYNCRQIKHQFLVFNYNVFYLSINSAIFVYLLYIRNCVTPNNIPRQIIETVQMSNQIIIFSWAIIGFIFFCFTNIVYYCNVIICYLQIFSFILKLMIIFYMLNVFLSTNS